VGKTYEALKRAEEERQTQAPGAPEVQAARPTTLPAPAGRSWFRFGRREQNGTAKNGQNGNGNGNGSPFKYASTPTTVEEFQQLRKNLLATKTTRPLQLMLVVSSRHGEGATTTTALLGSTMAQAGRCLLIDANFRTPGLTRHFHASEAAGVCEALADDPAARRIHYIPTDVPNLYFMPTGRGPARIPYLFEGRAFDDLASTLRRDFDSILVDGAPMEMYADSAFLAPRADGVILVIGAETTPLYAPASSLRELERVGAHVLGAVLNRRQDFIPRFIDRFSNPQDVVEVAIVHTGDSDR
jgi:capsular exopolysaccharide synthesis family protein